LKEKKEQLYLKNITIKGFKTFAEKTSLEFDSPNSITAIVGPNGCGKSNIVDALRFVLGEQSIKDLRGESLEQLIFAGTSLRKPLSLAEISITMDNSDNRLKADYSDVFIRRRVFRSGESEFYINKNLVRLKDIKELFLDTGVGVNTYSIINQGQVDSILSSKPEDRRAIFEEAAEIGKYRFKKRAAERRLIGTEQNLLRVNDLKSEIKDALATLEVQAAKAKEYKELKEQLKVLDIGLSKKQIKSLKEKKDALNLKIEELKTQSHGAEEAVQKEEEERQKIKASVRELEDHIENTRQEINSLRMSFENAKSSLSVNKERLLQLNERAAQLKEEKTKLESLLSARLSESNSTPMTDTAQQLSAGRQLIKELSDRLNSTQSELNRIKRSAEESAGKISVGKERILQLTERSDQLGKELERLENSLAARSSRLAEETSSLEQQKHGLSETEGMRERSQKDLDEISRVIEENIRSWNSLKNPIFEREMDISSKKHSIAEIELSIKYSSENHSKEKAFLDNLKGLKEDITLLENELLLLDGVSTQIKESISNRKSSIFSKIDIEISIIEKNVEAQQSEISALENKKNEESSSLSHFEKNAGEMTAQYNELEKKMNDLGKEKEKAILQLAEARANCLGSENAYKQKSNDIAMLKREISETESDLNFKRTELQQITQRITSTENEINALESSLPGLVENEKRLQFDADELTGKKTFEQKRLEVVEKMIELEQGIKQKEAEISQLETRIAATSTETISLEGSIPEFIEKESLFNVALQEKIAKKNTEQNKLDALEEKIRQASSEDRTVRDALSKEEVAMAKIDGEMLSIDTLLEQEYQMKAEDALLSDIPEVANQSRAKEEIETFRTRIRDLGAVNLLAVEEYESSKDRLSFIEAQYNDLVASRENLNSLIRQLDNEAKERFLSKIETVSGYFSEIFSSLFEGGEAKITLADGDPLEAGVEIMARPNGKKWISLSLMSGGEKSLTAIAILFALMRTNPSPFCIMDEVDAALDEINTIRFTRMLKQFAQDSQILIITHSKRTMSAADNLYGITQEEPGVSKIVSMKLVKVAD